MGTKDKFKDIVLCTCPQCIVHTRVDSAGIEIHGLLVHKNTRTRHQVLASTNSDQVFMQQIFGDLSVAPEPVPAQVHNNVSTDESEQQHVAPNEIICACIQPRGTETF